MCGINNYIQQKKVEFRYNKLISYEMGICILIKKTYNYLIAKELENNGYGNIYYSITQEIL